MAPRIGGKKASTARTRRQNVAPEQVNSTLAPIGTVEDGVSDNVATVEAPKEDASQADKVTENKQEAPVLSVAQLREWHKRRGTVPTTEEVNAAREVESKILEEGGKKHRTNEKE